MWLIILITFGISLGLGFGLTSEKTEKWTKRIGITLLGTAFAFMLTQVYQGSQGVKSLAEKVTDLPSLNTYMQALHSWRNLPQSPFRSLIDKELEDIDARLKQMTEGELRLKREEVIPRWEKLFDLSVRKIDATNLVSSKDWNEFSPNAGLEVHRDALQRGVRIRRIFIYDEEDPGHEEGLKKLSKQQMGLCGQLKREESCIDLKMISKQWVESSSFLSELLRDLGTIDVVVFDADTVLLTTVNSEKKIASSILTRNLRQLRSANDFYNKLWRDAQPISR
jgi:hypothetical protein